MTSAKRHRSRACKCVFAERRVPRAIKSRYSGEKASFPPSAKPLDFPGALLADVQPATRSMKPGEGH